ncbi:MAG: amino acid adenylation domain-containing protein [Methylococcaceae bacterium]|nr:amino acid adenylation domain-containing protein [Methylococcaceae bacterium]
MLLEPFMRQCRCRPEAPALRENGLRLSYGELLARSQFIAAALQGLGFMPGQRVAIHLDRGVQAVAAVFGVLLAGGCYVPLDLKNPPARLAFIIKDAEVSTVLGLGADPDWLEGVAWLDVERLPSKEFATVEVRSTDLAVILYTSGSTGCPKGVALSHGAVAAFAEWAADLLGLAGGEPIASSAPFFFDLSTFDLYSVLGRGACLHFVPSGLTLSPSRLSAWLQEQAIAGWYTVPTLLAFLAYKGNLAQTPLADLRFLIFAGEVFPSPALVDLAESLSATRLYNFFGPTETNVCCHWPVDRQCLDPSQAIPIGWPAAGCELHVHEENGELWVRGPGLASGYWSGGRLQEILNREGWYPTGDRVSRNERGEYLFHGRLGRMLKCSGYRVEPAEIEAALHALPGVKGCVVVGLNDPTAGQRPALVLALEPGLDLGEVRQFLQRRLPAYMQPCRWQLVEELPRLPNGKTDYQAINSLLEVS